MCDGREQIAICGNAETLARCALGDLPPDQQELVTVHVDECSRCQRAIGELGSPCDEFLASLRHPLADDAVEDERECATSVSRAEAALAEASDSDTRAKGAENTSPEFEQLGPYRLLDKIGTGGMGTVYKARHTELDRIVAIKILSPARVRDPDAVARFDREVKAIGRLEHPHVVNATDAGQDHGVRYLAMEFVDGINLSQLQRRLGPLPVAEACELVRQAAVGLHYIHQQGQVHRDIKPSNLMLTVSDQQSAVCGEQSALGGRESGVSSQESGDNNSAFRIPHSALVKILDLGLALLSTDTVDDELTTPGQVMGTVDYMSPEQLEQTHRVDIRSDIYSLGATLHKLLSGHAPFSGREFSSKWQKLAALEKEEAPSIRTRCPELPTEVANVVDRMLSRSPKDRFDTPHDVALALVPLADGANLVALFERAQAVSDDESSKAHCSEFATCTPGRSVRRRRRLVWAALACVALPAVACLAWLIRQTWRTEPASHFPLPTVLAHQKISALHGGFTGQLGAGDGLGRSLAGVGDLDGDGVSDLAAGACMDNEEGRERGAVWVLFLNADGTVKRHQKISPAEGGFAGELADGDCFGRSLAAAGDLDNNGAIDLAVGAARDDDGGENRGAIWLLFLSGDGTVKQHQKISCTDGGFTGELVDGGEFGNALAGIGDLNGDGVGDLAVASKLGRDVGDRGAVWLLMLNEDGTVKQHGILNETTGRLADRIADGTASFGRALAGLGDLDGDGVVDLAVGAIDEEGGRKRGAVWILFLTKNGSVKRHQKISKTEGGFSGAIRDNDMFGSSLANLGDINGDGRIELAVGAPLDNDGGPDRGAVWLLSLKRDGTVASQQKISLRQGGFRGTFGDHTRFGFALADVGGPDARGVARLAVGPYMDRDAARSGAVWILSLGPQERQDKPRTVPRGDRPPVAGFGRALDLSGTRDFVVLANDSRLEFGTSDFTIEAWFRTTAKYPGHLFANMGAYQICVMPDGITGRMVTGTLLDFKAPIGPESGGTLNDGRWHHLAAVFDRDGDFTAYVDGVALPPTDISGLSDELHSGRGALIGEYNPGFEAGKWDGQLDEIRIWKTALTQNQIRAWSHREVDSTHPAYAHLQGYWQMNRTDGTTVPDSSPNGIDGHFMDIISRPYDAPGRDEAVAAVLPDDPGARWIDSTVGTEFTVDFGTTLRGQLAGSDPGGTSTDGTDWTPTFSIVNPPAHGTAKITADNRFEYTPATNENTTDTFTYRLNDGTRDSNEFTVAVSIRASFNP